MDKGKIIDELLSRGVGEFIDPDGTFRKKLENNPKDVFIKLGVDPTRPDIHIGHAVILRTLRRFQDLGCKVIFLIGDFTTLIGDPTGKSKVRPEISQKEIEANMHTYLNQVGKILSTEPDVFSWMRNSDWFLDITDISAEPKSTVTINNGATNVVVDANSFVGKAALFENTRMQKTHLKKNQIHTVSFSRILGTLRQITHARLIERDMFKDRLQSGQELYMHEMMYPVLQGIDSSVLMNIYGACDLEVGGTDQTFNILMGRDVMRINKQPEQAVLTFKLLEGLDGKEKMSKSLDNYIAITDEPFDMYGKVMSIPDTSIPNYFELCTYTPMERIAEIKSEIMGGKINPRDLKMELARQIVAEYYGEPKAKEAEADFIAKFQKKEIPDNVPEINASGTLVDILIAQNLVPSKSEFRRLVEGGAITNLTTGEKIADPTFSVDDTGVFKIGKHTFVKIIVG